ncbi:hypothetical protein A2U01_0113346, partial [Trifolium medium]|nr:hypothetical protein [Trifolium medium]
MNSVLRLAQDLWSWAQMAAISQEKQNNYAPGSGLWSWARMADCAESAEKCNFERNKTR